MPCHLLTSPFQSLTQIDTLDDAYNDFAKMLVKTRNSRKVGAGLPSCQSFKSTLLAIESKFFVIFRPTLLPKKSFLTFKAKCSFGKVKQGTRSS